MLKRLGAVLLVASLLVPAVAADHGTNTVPACKFAHGFGGLVGLVLDTARAGTCLVTGFVDATSHLTLCLLLGGPNC